MIHAMFPQIGLRFLENRDNPEAFEPAPGALAAPSVDDSIDNSAPSSSTASPENYRIVVNGNAYDVQIEAGGEVRYIAPSQTPSTALPPAAAGSTQASKPAAESLASPLAGTVFKVKVQAGQAVETDQVLFILEAMKMETEVRSLRSGTVAEVLVREGDAVKPGDPLCKLA